MLKKHNGHEYNDTSGCLLDYPYIPKHYKVIALDLNNRKKFDADPKALQQVNSTGNLDWTWNTSMFFILEKAKKKFWIFHVKKRIN